MGDEKEQEGRRGSRSRDAVLGGRHSLWKVGLFEMSWAIS